MIFKLAYPNDSEYFAHEKRFDVSKWVASFRELKVLQNRGTEYTKAFDSITDGWDGKEVRAFTNWMRFYEEAVHVKYKTANLYGQEGYYLPTKTFPSPVVPFAGRDTNLVEDAGQEIRDQNRKDALEQHRRKILSRLQSARKLLTEEKGKTLAGPHWEKFLDTLNLLEKEFHTVKVASQSFYDDLVARRVACLEKSCGSDASKRFLKFADLPGAALPANPNASIPQGGALPNNTPNLETPPGIVQFLNGLSGKNPFDIADADFEEDEYEDEEEVELDSEDDLEIDLSDSELIVTAQEVPPPAPAPLPEAVDKVPAPAPVPAKDKPEPGIEVVEGEFVMPPAKDFDAMIDAAFSTLKVGDVVRRLDDLSRIFKNREIARQLAVVDMMMDRLGLSSFFPSLAEATRSALESNQYCLIRIDEVKSRLSGALDSAGKSLHDMGETHTIRNQQIGSDLFGKDPNLTTDPLVGQVKENLDTLQKKEKLKKDIKRNLEQNALIEQGNKQKAEVADMTEDFNALPAVELPAPTPVPTASAAPAPVPAVPVPPVPAKT